VNNSRGFTLIELILIVVIIGILASIAIPKFGNTKEKAYVAGMKADLRNLVTAQEAYFAEHVVFASTTSDLNYNVSVGNAVFVVSSSGKGWSGTATNSGTAHTCSIYIGNATPPMAGYEGQPVCK